MASSVSILKKCRTGQVNKRSIAWLQQKEQEESIDDQIDLFVTSHFHDNYLLSLEIAKDVVTGDEPEKR